MPKTDFVDSGVPAIHYGQIYTRFGTSTTESITYVDDSKAQKLAKVHPGDIIITNTSENIDDVCKALAWLGNQVAVTGGHATVIKHHEDPLYLVYFFRSSEFDSLKRKLQTGTKVIDVSAKSLTKVPVPLPPIEVQSEIAKHLKAFDELLIDVTIGLPAEINARRKQYEYYRDKLLTFEEKVA